MSKIRLAEPASGPLPSRSNVVVVVGLLGLSFTCVLLLIAVAVLAYFAMDGGDSKPTDRKVAVVAEQSIENYAENIARVCEFMAQQVLDKKVKNKVTLSSQSNSKSAAARLAAFEELGDLDNSFFPDDFEGREQEVADYLKACAEGHRRAVK